MIIERYDANRDADTVSRQKIIEFLFHALESYGDPKHQIEACLNYALGNAPNQGGAVWVAKNDEGQLLGAVVVNKTHMQGYIPEYLLVYIAVAPGLRGQGVGKQLMQAAIHFLPGSIALHVEAANPALKLYERLGFQNKYLEMRLEK